MFQNRQLNEITADDLRAFCSKVKARGAPATAVHLRDIVKQVYAFAILHGEKVDNPAHNWHGNGDVRSYRPPSGWTARADLIDIHPITGRALPCAVWWLIETKE